MKKMSVLFSSILFLLVLFLMGGCCSSPTSEDQSIKNDEELARLLVKLELRTRGVIASHYVRADEAHKKWLAEDVFLPAAVADGVFYETVAETTGERAWVKMVVENPRNPHNTGDPTAIEMMNAIKAGETSVARNTAEAAYYAEPIITAKGCLLCHGEPAGEPDPYFSQYKKDGWKAGEVIGAVVARVAPLK
jgi:hypothetical protein